MLTNFLYALKNPYKNAIYDFSGNFLPKKETFHDCSRNLKANVKISEMVFFVNVKIFLQGKISTLISGNLEHFV